LATPFWNTEKNKNPNAPEPMVSSNKTLIDNQLIYQSLGQAQLWKNVCLGTVDSGGDYPNKFVTLIVLSLV